MAKTTLEREREKERVLCSLMKREIHFHVFPSSHYNTQYCILFIGMCEREEEAYIGASSFSLQEAQSLNIIIIIIFFLSKCFYL